MKKGQIREIIKKGIMIEISYSESINGYSFIYLLFSFKFI